MGWLSIWTKKTKTVDSYPDQLMAWTRSTHKYNATQSLKCAYGFSHRSKLESSVCQLIYLREKAGELVHINHEQHVYLTKARILFIPDFHCLKDGKDYFIEAKGMETPEYRIKRRLWMHYALAPLEVWKGSHTNPKLSETIIPVSE